MRGKQNKRWGRKERGVVVERGTSELVTIFPPALSITGTVRNSFTRSPTRHEKREAGREE